MLKLILIELKKVFKKKSIFVMMIIMLLFNLLNNILFYIDYDENGNYKYLDNLSYLDKASLEYQENLELLNKLEGKKLKYEEKYKYQIVKEKIEINKYILENKKNYNKQNNLNYQLRTIIDDYEIFIIIVILIVGSSIVAEEFTSGTIKLLLIKPYSRGKILLSKYFTGIIIMFIIIIYLMLIQLFIGGIIFGFSSLKIPVIVYNFNKNIVIEYNVFVYMIIRIITKLPLLVMLFTISFSLSTIVNSVAIAIIIPLFFYIFTPSIMYLITYNKINIMKYLVNINWEFNNYLFGKISEIEGLNFKVSLIIWIAYFVVIMVITYLNFKKKNIRNV